MKKSLAIWLLLSTTLVACGSKSELPPSVPAVVSLKTIPTPYILSDSQVRYAVEMSRTNVITENHFDYIKDRFGICYSVIRFTLQYSDGVSHTTVPCDKVGL